MNRLVFLMKFSVALATMFVATNCNAQNVWTGGGDGIKWEDGGNWSLGIPPTDPNLASDDRGPAVQIQGNSGVLFDADSWQWVIDNNQQNVAGPFVNGLETQHWGMGRLLMGTSTNAADDGDQTFTFDHGGTNFVNFPNTNSNILGERSNKNSTLNVLSGIVELGGNPVRLGTEVDSSGTINLMGGQLILFRANFQIASNGSASVDGNGTCNISGGALTTRQGVSLGANGTFNVVGSAATEIGIGSAFTLDGEWNQFAGGLLRTGLDSGGITPILIDDVDNNGVGGDVVFENGAILDPYDAGGASDPWTTVMTWDGTLTDNGLALSTTATSAGWEMRFLGNELQVRNLSLTGSIVGDFNGDGDVDCDDLDGYVDNIGAAAAGALAALDIDGDGFLSATDANTHITNLVVTSNGVTGTFPGDLNCDGTVNVLGDAFALVANLNGTATMYSQGDINFDGNVNVLGDAFALVSNLGMSN